MLLREAVLDYIRQYPILFFLILSFKKKYKYLLVDKETDIVIEGYPRSANTFAVAAFKISQKNNLKIARHTHAVAQLKRAAALEIPALAIIREPKQAILSYVVREKQVNLNLAINRYITYYQALKKLENKFIIADFKDITKNYGDVIFKINNRFHTNFLIFKHTKENVEKTFRKVEDMEREDAGGALSESKVARPSDERNRLKATLLKKLDQPTYRKKLEKCESLYNQLTVNNGLP